MPATEQCPFCKKQVPYTAARCPFCGEQLFETVEPAVREATDAGLRWLVPIGRSGWAIASGYLGLVALFPLCGLPFAIAAVVTGILALVHMRRNPRLSGRGRAIFGLITGGLGTLFWGGALIALLIAQLLKK